MESLYQAAKETANNFGFIVTEMDNYDHESGKVVPCVKVDRIGPPAMLKAWTPSPFNDRFCSGARYFFIEWVARLNISVEMAKYN